MRDKVERLLKQALQKQPNVVGVYGFGSFFRSNTFNDIDIAIVTDSNEADLLHTHRSVAKTIEGISQEVGSKIDFLLFTKEEFDQKPLLESGSMILIFQE